MVSGRLAPTSAELPESVQPMISMMSMWLRSSPRRQNMIPTADHEIVKIRYASVAYRIHSADTACSRGNPE